MVSPRLPLARAALRLLPALALAAGCAGPEEQISPLVDCSIEAQNARLLQTMRDIYLWYDQIPDVDPAAYDSPEALLEAIRFAEKDPWTHVSPAAAQAAYYSEGQTLGVGVRWKINEAEDALGVALVYPGSAAADAGMQRGDEVVALNGVSIATIAAEDRWVGATGEDAEGVPVTIGLRRPSGVTEEITVHKRVYTLLTTHGTQVFDVEGHKIGYLYLDRFIGPAVSAIREAFASFREAGVQDLILDMRYNGGGLIEVSRILASMIGGKEIDGRTYNLTRYNARHTDWNETSRFGVDENALNLERVAVIATGSTASASELVINNLDPWIRVGVIGGDTYGKPVGSKSYDDCGLNISPIMFRSLNADGTGDYYEGLPADCPAEDQLSAPLGDQAEASVAEAIHWLMSTVVAGDLTPESCSPASQGARVRRYRPVPLTGLREEIGAF